MLTDKAYTATIRLGQATVTDDAEGEVLADASGRAVDRGRRPRGDDRARPATIEQVPSAVSAIKVDGRRAYDRVRAGEDGRSSPPAPVTVRRFDAPGVRPAGPDLLDVDVAVECSSGTYVRALARDLGAALGVGGHLTALRRTRVGPFTLARARTLDELAALDDPVTLPLADAVRAAMPVRDVDADEARELSFGRVAGPAGHRRRPRRARRRTARSSRCCGRTTARRVPCSSSPPAG